MTLWKAAALTRRRPTEGRNRRLLRRRRGKSLRSRDRGGANRRSSHGAERLQCATPIAPGDLMCRSEPTRRDLCIARRCTRCTCALGAAWCRSPATRCRCSIRTGILNEHIWTRENAGLFDVSHMGQAILDRARPRDDRARRSRRWCPADIVGLEARPAALHPAAQRRRRHPRRPDGDALRRPGRGRRADAGRQRLAQGRRLTRTSRARLPPSVQLDARSTIARCSPCRGRRRPRSLARLVPGRRPHDVHAGARHDRSTASTATSRARATPARTATRSRCRPTTRASALRDAAAGRSARCKPIGLGARDSLRLEAGLCLYGHDIDETTIAGRGRAGLVDPEAPPRARAAFPAPRASSASWPTARRAGASACCPRAARRRARARRSPTPDGRDVGVVTSAASARALERPDRHGLCRRRASPSSAPRSTLMVRGKPLPAAVVAAAVRSASLRPQD